MIVTCNQKLVWHIFAILLSVVGSLILFADRFIIQEEVRSQVTLTDHSEYLQQWINDTTPLSAKFYVLNITNSHLVESGDEAEIQFQPLGPFVFNVKRERHILFMNDSVIEYQPLNYYSYDESLPENAPLDQLINMANVPLATVMRKSHESGPVADAACALLAVGSHSKVFTQRSVREILFEGYKDPLITLVKLVEETARLPGADEIPDEFAIMKDQNGLPAYGNWTVMRGLEDPDQTLRLVRWNGGDRLNFWKGSHCNDLRGNDGSKFRSGVTESDILYLFLVSDFCSGIPFTFDSYSNVGSVSTMRFKFDFANSTAMDCLPDTGAIDVSACHSGAPIFLSAPDFEPPLTEEGDQMSKNRSHGESFMDIEPVSGLLLRIVMRLQVNVRVTKNFIFPMTRRIPFEEKIIPIVWIEQFAEASADQIQKLDREIFLKERALQYISWSLIVIGTLIVVLIHGIVHLKEMREDQRAEHLVRRDVSVSVEEVNQSIG